MEKTIVKGQVEALLRALAVEPAIQDNSNIISLTSNELADISLKISKYIRKELPLNELLENTMNILGEAGIGERILLFQIDPDGSKALLSYHWESPYLPRFNPVGYELNLQDTPLFKHFNLTKGRTFQIEDFSKYLALPNYLFKNKFKALFIKLKTKSVFVTTGSTDKVRVALNLQFSTKQVIWSNEIEKVLQSIVDQLTSAIQQFSEKKKKESLEKNIMLLQESAIKEQEELLRQFAGDLHDLPCSIIPSLKQAIRERDFNECEKLVDELHKNLRQLINEYVIPDISLLGFVTTIYQFINGFKKTFKGEVNLELPNEEINISQKKAVELFKVIKEWFCNIEKHSRASKIHFELKRLNECYILITISDNGKGFDTNNSRNFGYGILNMKRRLVEMGAKFEIKSEVNDGAILKLQLCLT